MQRTHIILVSIIVIISISEIILISSLQNELDKTRTELNLVPRKINLSSADNSNYPSLSERMIFANKFNGNSTEKLDSSIKACGNERCFIFATPEMNRGGPSIPLPDNVTMIDLRQESFRVIQRDFPMTDGSPQGFADKPSYSTIVAGSTVRANESNHVEDQSIAGLINNENNKINAVGVWGGATSKVEGANVWGGFFSAGNTAGKDAQIIGLEVDTINRALPGLYPYASKVGIQVVGLGYTSNDAIGDSLNLTNTNAIEIIADKPGRWLNGIDFARDSMQKGGTIIGVDKQNEPLSLGLNFASVNFTDAAIRVGQDSKIRLDTNENPAVIYTDKTKSQLVLGIGPGGLRIMSNDNSKTLMEILPNGTLIVHGKIKQVEDNR